MRLKLRAKTLNSGSTDNCQAADVSQGLSYWMHRALNRSLVQLLLPLTHRSSWLLTRRSSATLVFVFALASVVTRDMHHVRDISRPSVVDPRYSHERFFPRSRHELLKETYSLHIVAPHKQMSRHHERELFRRGFLGTRPIGAP